MALLTEKYARLEAQLEVQEQKSRIKELEQEVNNLKADKRPSAQNSGEQALQLAMPTGSSDSALRAETAQLQRQIAKLDTKVSSLFEVLAELPTGLRELATHLESKIEQGVAGALDIGRELTVQAADEEHEPQKEPTSSLSITDNQKPESPPASQPKAYQGDVRSRPDTPSESTPAKFSADSSSDPTASYAQMLQTPHNKQSLRRARVNQAAIPFTHANLSAKKSAEQQLPPEAQKQQISQRSNSSFAFRRPRPRGSHRVLQERSVSTGKRIVIGGPEWLEYLAGHGHSIKRGDPRPDKGSTLLDLSSKTQGR